MALPQIETGYKPEFALGALYQGMNAANANNSAQEEIVKQFLANQREQTMQPLDTQVRQWDAASAQDKLNDPLFRRMMIESAIGRGQSEVAKGRFDTETLDPHILQAIADYEQKTGKSNLLSGFQQEQRRAIDGLDTPQLPEQSVMPQASPVTPQPSIGFPMNQPQPSQWGGEGRATNADIVVPIGNQARESQMIAGVGTDAAGATPYDIPELQRELARTKDPKIREILTQELERALSIANSGQQWTPVNQQFQPNDGLPPTQVAQAPAPQQRGPLGSKLRQMATILGTTPEHMSKLEELQVGADSRIRAAEIAAEARINAANQAHNNADTIKAKELDFASKLEQRAIQYETLVNKQDIEAQKNAVLLSALGQNEKQAKLRQLSELVMQYQQEAKRLREQANKVYTKHGFTDIPAPSAPTASSPQKVIKLD